MPATHEETIARLFDRYDAGDIGAAVELMTDDVVVDVRNSTAPWRGLSHGRAEARAALEEFRRAWEDVGGVSWEHGSVRSVGPRFAVETTIRGRGPASGLTMYARATYLISFDGARINEAVLFQNTADALYAGRRRALTEARLYFVCEALPNGSDPTPLLEAAIRGGAGVIQLREKAPRCAEELISFAEPFRRVAREHGAIFFLNDEPGLVEACDADGVHVGQRDASVAEARAEAGPGALVGLSSHSVEQLDEALGASGAARADEFSVGPVWETPTKEGRPAAGLALVEHAARTAGEDDAWFAIGGIDASNVGDVVAAGGRRIVVVRAIRDAGDPEAAAAALRAALPD